MRAGLREVRFQFNFTGTTTIVQEALEDRYLLALTSAGMWA
jgi:hypothetical protein